MSSDCSWACTAALPVAAALRDAMQAKPLAKPRDHKGGPATDMYDVDLDAPTVAAIGGDGGGAAEVRHAYPLCP